MVDSATISFYEAVLRCDPDDVDARVKLGWLYEDELHDHDAALMHLQTALAKEPRSAEAGFWLATAYFHHAEFESARTAFEQVLESHPDHVPSLSLLASVYVFDLDEPQRAVGLLQRALELAPSWGNVHAVADRAYLDLRETALAKKNAKEAARLAEGFHSVSTPGTYNYFESAITGRWVNSETLAQLKYRAASAR